jgi:hypothetical protein
MPNEVMGETGVTSGKPLGPRDVALVAARYLMDVTGYTGGITIEEVERTETGWRVTVGYFEPPAAGGTGVSVFLSPPKKSYKVIEVDAATGQAISMKIRQL